MQAGVGESPVIGRFCAGQALCVRPNAFRREGAQAATHPPSVTAKFGDMLGTFGAIREVDRLWLQFQHTPNFRECGFSVSALLLGEPCAFGIEPQGAFLFRCELLQSRAHKRELNPLEPVGRFARLHASILPPAGRNLPQGREQRKCLPRFGQRAGVASAGVGY